MSDSYEALIDCLASQDEARVLAPLIVQSLSRSRLIEPELSLDCGPGPAGYRAGPACAEAYTAVDRNSLTSPNRFWTLRSSGVQVYCEPWVNAFGFTVFEGADCPVCHHQLVDEFLDDAGEGVETFTSSGVVPSISCPACGTASMLHDWNSHPPLGFVNLAVVFWNWPPFDDPNWTISVPALLEQELKRPFVRTYGHV